MGWTILPGHRRSQFRRRPQIEHLDDRCLLSAGLGNGSFHAVAEVAPHRPSGLVGPRLKAGLHAKRAGTAPGGHAGMAKHRERPAGTTSVGTATSYDPVIGAAQARSTYHVTGAGMTVAVIDTGVDYNNPALGGSFGPGAKVIAGYDFAANSADPKATASQHGTAVAGLIGSNDPKTPGVAPDVQIVALRVTDEGNSASLTSIASALQWVIDHRDQYHINVVNMSLSDGRNYAQNWFAHAGGAAEQITGLIGQLKGLNVPVVAATGNNFNQQQGEGFTAIVDGTISVTATDLSDHLLSNAQRLGPVIGGSSATTIAAPGQGFPALSGGSGTVTVDGTSFAAPLVSGAVVLLQQIYQSRFGSLPSVDQIKSWLTQGSDPVYDPVTGITIGRLDIPEAAGLIPQAPAPSRPVVPPPKVVVPTAPAAPGAPATAATQVIGSLPGGESGGSTAAATPAPTNWESLLRARALSFWATASAAHVRVWTA